MLRRPPGSTAKPIPTASTSTVSILKSVKFSVNVAITRDRYSTTTDYFKSLLQDPASLKEALQNDPDLINEQDENQDTLLHWVPCMENVSQQTLIDVMTILLNAPKLDLTIKNMHLDTPLHVAAKHCAIKNICLQVFYRYLEKAAAENFDFEQLNKQGQSILHFAARLTYLDNKGLRSTEYANNVSGVLQKVPTLNLDLLSSSGTTAFFYSIHHLQIHHAMTLLEKGADPALYGNPERNPINELQTQITKAQNDPKLLAQLLELDNKVKTKLEVRQKIKAFRNQMKSEVEPGARISMSL